MNGYSLNFPSDNRKSAIQSLSRTAIRDRKWVGIVALVITFTMGGVEARAQQLGKIFRIGFLSPTTASGSAGLLEVFRQELRKLGWIEGKNITIDDRFAEQKPDRLPELAADLVRLKVDLIAVVATPAALAAKGATSTIPIVMVNAGDPVDVGLIASLAQPGGTVTGISSLAPELNTKALEILKDTIPKLTRVGYFRTAAANLQPKELRAAALALKLKLEEIETEANAKGLESAFKIAKQKEVGAMMTHSNPSFFTARKMDCRACQQIPAACDLPSEGVCH